MPLQRCQAGGKRGWQWGSQRCFTGPRARARALAQARAILASGGKALAEELEDRAFWDEQREIVTRVARRRWLAAFLAGAMIAAEDPRVAPELDAAFGSKSLSEGSKASRAFVRRVNEAARIFIEEFTNEWWQGLEANLRDALRGIISDAEVQALPMETIQRRVSELFSPVRAEMIAVTETTRLMGGGAQETYRQAGFRGWKWRTVNDPAVDTICADRQARSEQDPYPMSRRFEPAHVNCRCWPVPVGPVERPLADV